MPTLLSPLKMLNKTDAMDRFTLKGSQFQQPLLEFSGACAGCGETPYVKLLTQLFGERMVVANATAAAPFGVLRSPVNPYRPIKTVTVPLGATPCLKTRQNMVLACTTPIRHA